MQGFRWGKNRYVELAIYCATQALPHFESKIPNDSRPRHAIYTAEGFLAGTAREGEAESAAAASWAAAWDALYRGESTAWSAACSAASAAWCTTEDLSGATWSAARSLDRAMWSARGSTEGGKLQGAGHRWIWMDAAE